MAVNEHRCPVDERERDQIWQEIDSVRKTVHELEKTAVSHSAQMERLAGRIENVQTRIFERIDHINKNTDFLVAQVTKDSAELRRREGASVANKRWLTAVIGILGLVIGTGGFIGFQAADAAIIKKDPQEAVSWSERIERTIE